MTGHEAMACSGKARHQTKGSAQRHANHTGHGLPYRCEFCGLWHIGNKAKPLPRHIRKEAGRTLRRLREEKVI